MDYLTLCQEVARESGGISGVKPVSVTGQEGRLQDIVKWTDLAWSEIQNQHDTWLFMRKEFTSTTITSSSPRYTPASWSLTDHAEWITEEGNLSLYDNALGVSDEGKLLNITWKEWRERYDRGLQVNNRPTEWAISPAGELCLGAIPDKSTYKVKGEYVRAPQVLAENADIPIMPARFHTAIQWQAILFLGTMDEATDQVDRATLHLTTMMNDLTRAQLPKISKQNGMD